MSTRSQRIIRDYFTFSAKERKGLLVFFILSLLIFFGVRYYPIKKTTPDKTAFQQELATLKIVVDSSSKSYNSYSRNNSNDYNNDYDRSNKYDNWKTKKSEVFPFDPNTLDASGWERLGLKERTINIIQNFLAKGYKFKQPEDLKKIYGLRPEDAERLMPYVKIAEAPANTVTPTVATTNSPYGARPANSYNKIININTADTTAFIALPGIGGKLANRIINYRDRLGGFVSVLQVGETFGLPDSTFQKIKIRFECPNPDIKKVNVNTADVSVFKTHPYIRWNIANAVYNYRIQHGNFKSLDELKKIDLINEELYQKLLPYLTL